MTTYTTSCVSQDEIIDYLNESDDFDPQTFDNLFDSICAKKHTIKGDLFGMKTITLTDKQFDNLFDYLED